MRFEDQTSFLRQLARLKRSVVSAMQELQEAIDSLPAPNQFADPSDVDDRAANRNFYGDCLRLEVALDEARVMAKKVARQSQIVANRSAPPQRATLVGAVPPSLFDKPVR